MPRQYCFLCASDEGVFLDITADNKQTFYEQLEICELVKIPATDQFPTKICHKCAYELNQCSSFVQKYKSSIKQKTHTHKRCCSVCLEPAKKAFTFDLKQDRGLQHNSHDKIQKLFDDEIGKSYEDHKLICLSCRYTIDVLVDLKNVSKEASAKLDCIINEEIDYLTFPKIKTTVVSRKTTNTESARVYLSEQSDSDSSKMTLTRSQRNRLHSNESTVKSKPRACDSCRKSMRGGDNMYKVHKTGDTVCKSCWRKVDPRTNKIETQECQNLTETKQCSVFLKDVLKNTEERERHLCRIDEDDQGNKKYIVTDTGSSSDSKQIKVTDGGVKQGQKRTIKNTKGDDEDVNNENGASKKRKSETVGVNKIELEKFKPVEQKLRKLRQKRNVGNVNQNSHSDSSVTTASVLRNGRTLTKHKRATGASLSDADVDSKRNRRKLSAILNGVSTVKSSDVSDESSSNDDGGSKRKRLRFTSASPTMIDTVHEVKTQESSKENAFSRRKRTRATSLARLSQEFESSESDDKVIFKTETYVCDECGASYENKLMGLSHQLQHYKQLKLKLQKLSDENIVREIVNLHGRTYDREDAESETSATVINDDAEPTMRTDYSNTNDDTETGSDLEDKNKFARKEMVEDAVDLELVMKESDDDLTERNEKQPEKDEASESPDVEKCETERCESPRSCNGETVERDEKLAGDENESAQEKQDTSSIGGKDVKEAQEMDTNEKAKENDSEVNVEEEEPDEGVAVVEENDGETEKSNTEDNEEKEAICEEKENSIENAPEKDDSDSIRTSFDKNPVDVAEKTEGSVADVAEITATAEPEEKSDADMEEIKLSEENETRSESPQASKFVEEVTEADNVGIEDTSIKDSETDVSEREKSPNDSTNAAAEVLKEVLELASAEVQKRQEQLADRNMENDSMESETLENISREIQNSVDMLPVTDANNAKSEDVNSK